MIRIALDLELDQPWSEKRLDMNKHLTKAKIIEIGFCIFDGDTFLERHGLLVNPGVPLSDGITKLCNISQDMMDREGDTLLNQYNKMLSICDKYKPGFFRQLITWGSGDHESLREELGHEVFYFGNSYLNLKAVHQMYSIANGINRHSGLSKSMAKYGMLFKGTKHRAIDDAYNTALLYNKILGEIKKT